MKKYFYVIVVLLIAIALIFVPSALMGEKNTEPEAEEASAPIFTVRTVNAEIRTLQAYIELNANIVSGHQVTVMPDIAGRLISMKAGLGSVVRKGELVAEVDPSRPGMAYLLSPVYAPVSGMVVSVSQTVGSTVSAAAVLMTLAVNGSTEIEASIPEREIGQLRTGLEAQIRLEAFPSETFAATLTHISPVLDPVSRIKKVTLRFVRNDQRINPGMFARVKLNTRTYENVVSVPQDALIEQRGKTIVYVLNIDSQNNSPVVQLREVVVGVSVNRETEIKSGLEGGEAVVIQGHQFLTDGALVRVIGSKI